MTTSRVAEAIAELRALATNTATPYENLLAKAHALMRLAPMSIGTFCPIGQELYRGTSHHNSVPVHQADILYPPPHAVRTYGRANCPGKPMFYCSSDPNGVFRELGSQVGQYAVLAKWATTKPGVLHGLGYSSAVFQRAKARREPPEPYRDFDAASDPQTRAIREFLALEFTVPNPSDYRLTAALADVFLAGDDFAGIAYPTIAKDCNADNLALLPAFVDSSLRLVEAQVVLIDDVQSDGSVGGEVIARLDSVDNGALKWNYSGLSSTTLPSGAAAVLRIKPGDRSRVQEACSVSIDGQVYDMRPGYSIELVDDEVCVLDLQSATVRPTPGTARQTPFWPAAYGDDVNRYLAAFASLYASATDVIQVRDTQVAIGVCFRAELTIDDHQWTLQVREGTGVEVHDPMIAPERLTWSRSLRWILGHGKAPVPVGVVVDALPGTLDALNARVEAIADDFYLPEGFELVYGCRGCESEQATNAFLAFCRSELKGIAKKIERGEVPELTEPTESKQFSRYREFEFSMPAGSNIA
jgi:hypothetical protein